MPEESSLFAVFDTAEATDAAAQALVEAGIAQDRISVVGPHSEEAVPIHEYVKDSDRTRELVTAGIVGGGLFGFLVGLAALWVPGIGPLLAAGPISAALLAGAEGAAVGAATLGLISGLVSLGVTEEQAREYEALVKEGKYLLICHGEPDIVQRAHDMLQEAHDPHTLELDVHAEYV
ncbi:MAG: hypothetical protein D6790_10700 [Caldilineae bacterium]|nr:MAG: hypothetical protein D6790_10700 [Caldilineae bacterium]